MNNETIISTVIGIVSGIIFTYWGIWYSKKLKDKHSLSLVNEQLISLVTTFQDKFETIKIEFTHSTNKNQYYYRGAIMNTGTTDLDKSRMYRPLEIVFPEDCKVNECIIAKQSNEKINIKNVVEDNKILFEWDLLKPKESFLFECLIESERSYNTHDIIGSIKIIQRIADLREIQMVSGNVEILSLRKFIWQKIGHYLGIFFFLIFFGLTFAVSVKSFFRPEVKLESETLHINDKSEVKLQYLNKNTLIVKHSNLSDTVNMKDLHRTLVFKPVVKIDKDNWGSAIATGAIFLAFIIGLIKSINATIEEYQQMTLFRHLKY